MPAISFQSVSKAYPSPRGPKGSTFLALDGVSLEIEEGEFFGLLGPNGAGKTTMISILAGLSRATSGKVSVLGHDVQTDYALARRSLGVVPQELVFDPFFNVREALRIQSGYFGVKNNEAWIDELLDSLGLADKAGANMRQLSGGMKRRVLVAQALVHKPPVIVLDEPTAGVDVELRQTLWQFIAKLNKQGHTVLLTTHYLEEAEALCGRIAMLKSGRIVALDHTSELLKAASSNVLRFKIDSELPKILADKARITGRIVQFPAHDALEIETYLAAVREAGLVAHDVEIRKADLEDVFLDVMKKNQGPSQSPGELRLAATSAAPEAASAEANVATNRSGDGEVRVAASVEASFTAGPPQGETAPLGGSEVRTATSVGAGSTAGPPQGEAAPSGGSEVRVATSVGAMP